MKEKREFSSGKEPGEISEDINKCHFKRNACRFLKVVIFVACSTGFGYQTEQFLANFYKYPTVLNMAVEKLEEFPTPAITFCSRFLFDFEKYCRRYNGRCKTSKELESFCLDRQRNCGGNETDALMPIEFPKRTDKTYVDNFALNVSEVFPYNSVGQDIEGPFFYSNHFTAFDEECYTLGIGFSATGMRKTKAGSRRTKWGEIHIFFTQRKNIYFRDESQPFGRLHMHSPFISSKLFTPSTNIEAGYDYKVYIRLEADSLLPFPYETDCDDYEALWKKNNMSGPLSRDMCEHVCLVDASYYFKSGFHGDPFGFYEDGCHEDGGRHDGWETCQCWKKCKDECLKLNFNFRAFTTTLEKRVDDNTAKVTFYIESNKVQFTHHRPKYEDVELFSYVGGLLGCWLGISIWTLSGILWDVYDVLEFKVHNYRSTSREKASKEVRTVKDQETKEVT